MEELNGTQLTIKLKELIKCRLSEFFRDQTTEPRALMALHAATDDAFAQIYAVCSALGLLKKCKAPASVRALTRAVEWTPRGILLGCHFVHFDCVPIQGDTQEETDNVEA